MRPVNGLIINPTKINILASCSEDGYVVIWNLDKFELVQKFLVSNFVKGISFLNTHVIRTWGAGN